MSRHGMAKCFNTQPPEGGWHAHLKTTSIFQTFQHTAARRRLEVFINFMMFSFMVSTHSRPKAAGGYGVGIHPNNKVSTHSRPKAAGCSLSKSRSCFFCFNTQPPEGGWVIPVERNHSRHVSTHSRPKAAGTVFIEKGFFMKCFNTQPPEGGWLFSGGVLWL